MTQQSFVNAKIDGDRVSLFYRNDAGTLMKRSVAADYISYHPADMEEDFVHYMKEDPRVLGMQREGDFWRVRWRGKFERREACKTMRENGIEVFEGDVNPIRRLISDYGLGIAKPIRLYFDIETDSRVNFVRARKGEARVLSWSAWDEHGNKWVAILSEWSDKAERLLLEHFWKLAAGYDQLVAWSGMVFDFPIMEQRSKKMGAFPVKGIDHWLWLDHHDVFERMNKNSAESGAEKQSLKLQDVGMQLVGHGKDDFDASKTFEAWEDAHRLGHTFDNVMHYGPGHEPTDHCRLVRYNCKDVGLMTEIEAESGYLDLFQTLCEVCGIFGNNYGLFPTQQMDGFMLRLGIERGIHFKTKWYDKEEPDFVQEQFEGAHVVLPSREGIFENVHVGDFASMYPTIIITLNMSPETKLGQFLPTERPEGSCRAPITGVCFSQEKQGILAYAVDEMIRLRKVWKDKRDACAPGTPEWTNADRRSNAYKVAANSFFGAMGNRFSRYYDEQIAESITTTGAWLLKAVLGHGEERGMSVVYGDTDSGMYGNTTREEFAAFVKSCNVDLFPKIVAGTGATRNRIKFDYEKAYKRIVFVKGNNGRPAKKRYVGTYAFYKGVDASADSKPEVKGLEWKRGDTNMMARYLQWDVIQLFHKGLDDRAEFEAAALKWRKHVLDDPLTIEEVKMAASLGKPLEEYKVKKKLDKTDAAQPAHVRVAKMLLERGAEAEEGTRIDFFVLDDPTKQVLPAEDYDGTCDRFYLWEKKVYPPSQRLLEAIFPDTAGMWKEMRAARPKKVREPRKAQMRRDIVAVTPTPGKKQRVKRSAIEGSIKDIP